MNGIWLCASDQFPSLFCPLCILCRSIHYWSVHWLLLKQSDLISKTQRLVICNRNTCCFVTNFCFYLYDRLKGFGWHCMEQFQENEIIKSLTKRNHSHTLRQKVKLEFDQQVHQYNTNTWENKTNILYTHMYKIDNNLIGIVSYKKWLPQL